MLNKHLTPLAIATVIIFTGCAGAGSGVVASKVSKFDSSKEVEMQTAWVAPAEGGMAEISLGLTFHSSKPNELILKANLTNMSGVTNIQNVAFNVDGKKIVANAIDIQSKKDDIQVTNDVCTYYYGVASCTKGIQMKSLNKIYAVPYSLAEDIMSAKTAYVRVEADGKYIEGDLKADSFGNHAFKDSLPKFIAEAKAH